MQRPLTHRTLLVPLLLALGMQCLVAPSSALAQGISISVGGPGGRGDFLTPGVTSKHLDKFKSILALSPEQAEAAQTLLDGYQTEFQSIADPARDKIDRLRTEARDTNDFTILTTELPNVIQQFREKASAMDKSFLSDLRLLLTEEQAARWPKVERTHRRMRDIGGGMLSGESVDLVQIVEGLKLPAHPEDLRQALDRYEVELDKALEERSELRAAAGSGMRPGAPQAGEEMEAMRKRMADLQAAGARVRDVNVRNTRPIESALPETARPQFADQVKRASFPRVYRESHTARALKAAAAFTDLDTQTAAAVSSLAETYSRQLESTNERWAAAITAGEGKGGPVGTSGGAVFMLGGRGQDDDPELVAARKARRELDNTTLDKLTALLTEDQKSRLPDKDAQNEDSGRVVRIGG